MRIAILGTRGIPARYGGFETFAQELSTRLVQRGHSVVVYGRRAFGQSYAGPTSYQGVELRITPTIMQKYAETPLHALTSFVDLLGRNVDVVLLCNAANSPFAFLARLKGVPLAINVDGIERRRKKWNRLGQLWYRLGEYCSVWWANRLIADAEVIKRYLSSEYGADSELITYGATVSRLPPGELLQRFGLQPQKYILYVSRLEPENNALGVIEAYERAREIAYPLVVVGDAPYASQYKQRLRAAASNRVVFTGFQFGAAYQELQSHAAWYVQATEVGGTHPALVEAMGYGNCVVANGTAENVEVVGEAGIIFPVNDFVALTAIFSDLYNNSAKLAEYRAAAAARVVECYSWEKITDAYERLFGRLVGRL